MISMPELTKCCRDCSKGPLFDKEHYPVNEKCRKLIMANFWRKRIESQTTSKLYTWNHSTLWNCPGYKVGPSNSHLLKENILQLKMVRAW